MCGNQVYFLWQLVDIILLLTQWGRVTHICLGKPIIIGSDNGLSPDRRQAIIWTNAGILLIRPLGRNFSEILIGIQTFSFKKMYLKMSSEKWRSFCLGLNVLNTPVLTIPESTFRHFRYIHIQEDYIMDKSANFPLKSQQLDNVYSHILRAFDKHS